MRIVPIGPGVEVVKINMREARRNGMPRNMAALSTYYWFLPDNKK